MVVTGSPARTTADAEVEERDPVVGAVEAEDLAQHAELEDRELVEDEDGDAAQHAEVYWQNLYVQESSPPLLAGTG